MRLPLLAVFACVLLALSAEGENCGDFLLADPVPTSPTHYETIFNGCDLGGWNGDPRYWSVQDGAITGYHDGGMRQNTFLVWDQEVENFVLQLWFRLEGNNSGIQYRSHRPEAGEEFVLAGYQADMDVHSRFTGMLYDERGRTFLSRRGQEVIISPEGECYMVGSVGDDDELVSDLDYREWNEYTVIAIGNQLVHKINGNTMVTVVDHDVAGRAMKGLLGFQLHAGPAMTVQFKDVRLKHLPAGGIVSPEDAPIPADAVKLDEEGNPTERATTTQLHD